jgi:hypothetical protein
MENNAELFSPEQSLQVIQTMIQKTRSSVADNSFFFLLWGWLIFIAALLQYVLYVIVQTNANGAAWSLMSIGFVVSIIRAARQKTVPVRTYVDDGFANIWICIVIVQALIAFAFFRRGGWENCYTFFILLYSVGSFLTGRLLKFAPLIWGAITCWVLAILTTFVGFQTNMLLMAAAVLLGYIVPGHLLRREYKMHLKAEGSVGHIKKSTI